VSHPEEHPDVALIRAHLGGSVDARRLLLARLAPILRARVRLFLRARPGRRIGLHDEEDLIQVTWCKLIEDKARRLSAYDPGRGVTLEGYVSMIVRRMLIDVSRSRDDGRLRAPLNSADAVPSPEDNPEERAIGRQELEALRAHLDRVLPDRGRLVARLLYDDHRTDDEAAKMLNVSKQVIANWKHKIKLAARDFRCPGEGDHTRGKESTTIARRSEAESREEDEGS
jgi:RNA polymerase sigma factor (sigma-70 family)